MQRLSSAWEAGIWSGRVPVFDCKISTLPMPSASFSILFCMLCPLLTTPEAPSQPLRKPPPELPLGRRKKRVEACTPHYPALHFFKKCDKMDKKG